MSDDTPNIVQRIRDALRGVTKGGWLVRGDAIMSPRVLVAVANSEPTVGEWRNNAALIAAAPGLLRDALARIEADAATIAALRERLRACNAEYEPYDCAEHGHAWIVRKGGHKRCVMCGMGYEP